MKSKIYLSLQMLFMILTIAGGILLFCNKIDNAGMAVCCMAISIAFGRLYDFSKKNK